MSKLFISLIQGFINICWETIYLLALLNSGIQGPDKLKWDKYKNKIQVFIPYKSINL